MLAAYSASRGENAHGILLHCFQPSCLIGPAEKRLAESGCTTHRAGLAFGIPLFVLTEWKTAGTGFRLFFDAVFALGRSAMPDENSTFIDILLDLVIGR